MAISKDEINPQELQVHLPENLRPGVYANLANVSANKREVTINFIYVNPQDNPQGTVVSRVILNLDSSVELAKGLESIVSTIKELGGE